MAHSRVGGKSTSNVHYHSKVNFGKENQIINKTVNNFRSKYSRRVQVINNHIIQVEFIGNKSKFKVSRNYLRPWDMVFSQTISCGNDKDQEYLTQCIDLATEKHKQFLAKVNQYKKDDDDGNDIDEEEEEDNDIDEEDEDTDGDTGSEGDFSNVNNDNMERNRCKKRKRRDTDEDTEDENENIVNKKRKIDWDDSETLPISENDNENAGTVSDGSMNDDDNDRCKVAFMFWLQNNVKLDKYMDNFRTKECNDIRMIELIDNETLKDIGINFKLHREFLLKHIEKFKKAKSKLLVWFDNNLKESDNVKDLCENSGVLTVNGLKAAFTNKEDLICFFHKEIDDDDIDKMWKFIQNKK